MCIFVCTCIHVECIHAYTKAHIHILFINVLYKPLSVCEYKNKYIYKYVHVVIYKHIYLYMHCVYVYIYKFYP